LNSWKTDLPVGEEEGTGASNSDIDVERVQEIEKERVGRRGVEPPIPAMSRRYPNQARPPARYTMKKIVAQIYVVDRLW
jgi:hypothetical protein